MLKTGVSCLQLFCFQLYLCFMCVTILPTCKSAYHIHAWCPWRPEDGVGFPRTGVTFSCELSCELGIEPGSSSRAASILNHLTISTALPAVVSNIKVRVSHSFCLHSLKPLFIYSTFRHGFVKCSDLDPSPPRISNLLYIPKYSMMWLSLSHDGELICQWS